MRHKFDKTVVIALGGSIMHPYRINVSFLKNFRKFILKWIADGKRFVVVAGGGSVARKYQEAASSIIKITNEDKDWLGIHATRMNAHLLRTIFKEEADPVVFDKRFKTKDLRFKITVASGWRPGWSTDYVALQIAADFGISEVVIAGSPAYVYDCDPKERKNAFPFSKISWRQYRELIPENWVPGSHAPVDSVGARLAHQERIVAIIVKGTDLKNLDKLFSEKNFKGTIIE